MSQVMVDGICPAVEDLDGALAPDVVRHVARCRRCRALIRAAGISVAGEVEVGPGVDRASVVRYRDRVEVRPGDVCAAEAPGLDERLIFVATQIVDGVVDAVPISEQNAFAGDRDLLLPPGVLGYEAMAETWNAGTLLVEEVAERLVGLHHAQRDQLLALFERTDGPKALTSAFATEEMERVLPFYRGASALQGISGLSELLSRWSEQSGTTIDELADRHGPWVADVAAGRPIDLVASIGSDNLVGLLFELKVPASRKVEEIVASTQRQGMAFTGSVADESGGRPLLLGLFNRRAGEADAGAQVPSGEDPSRAYARRIVEQLSERQLNPSA